MTQAEINKRAIDKKRAKQHCTWCNKPNDLFPKYLCLGCNVKRRAVADKWYLKLKLETFNAYGGSVCKCCGDIILGFLTLDHEDGNDWRKYKYRAGDKLYSELRKLNFPPGFRVLCFNCNIGRSNNGGICPHEKGL